MDDEAEKIAQTVRISDGFLSVIDCEDGVRLDAVIPAMDYLCQRVFVSLAQTQGRKDSLKVLDQFLKQTKEHVIQEIKRSKIK